MARTGARPQFGPPSTSSSVSAPQQRQASGLSESLDRLFDTLGGTLNALNVRRDAVAQIKSELSALRGSLQAAGRPGLSSGVPALRALVDDLELSVERAIYGTVDVFETQPVYETRDVYATRDVYETRPVYEQRDIRATIVTGTRDLSGFARFSHAGIGNGADFSIQVGSGASTTIKFASSTRITATVNGTTTNFNFASSGGEWRAGLLSALNGIADLTAQFTSDGRLELQTSDAQSLTIADVANGFFDFSDSPLASLGLAAGTTQSSVVGTEQVQVGTEEVVVGQEQYVAGQEQVEVGTEQVKVGTEQAEIGTLQLSAGTRAITVGFDRVAGSGGAVGVDDIQARVRELAVAINAFASSDRLGLAPATADSAQALAADLSALLESPDFAALASGADNGAFDRVMTALDDAIARADGLDTQFHEAATGAANTGQADLAALLFGSGLPSTPEDPVGLARQTAAMLIGSPGAPINGSHMSFRV
jgi:hypothetical protein